MIRSSVLANNWRLCVPLAHPPALRRKENPVPYCMIMFKLRWNCCNFYNVSDLLYYILKGLQNTGGHEGNTRELWPAPGRQMCGRKC